MLIDKTGKFIANPSGVKLTFSTEDDYLTWTDSFSNKDLIQNYVVVHDYEIQSGTICFVDQASELDTLPRLCKKESILYVVGNPKSMYYYTQRTNSFTKFI